MSPGDEEFVRTEAIPAWMAALAKPIIALAVSGVMVNGLLVWRNTAVLADRFERLEREFVQFKKPGARFSWEDGERHHALISANTLRIHDLEVWRRTHTEWGREKTGQWDAWIKIHEKRLDKLEQER